MGTITVSFGSGVASAQIITYNGSGYSANTYYSTQTFSNNNTSRYVRVWSVTPATNYKNATSSNWGEVYFNSGNQYIYLSATYDPPAPTYYYAYLYYNANGGTGSFTTGYNYSTTNGVSVPITVTSETPNTRTGWTFLGWATSSTATTAPYQGGDTYYVKTGQTATLYAVWQRITYTITLDANNGFFYPNYYTSLSETVNSGDTFSFSNYSASVSRDGYTFKGWGASSTTTTISYSANGSYVPTVSRTWYAIWESVTRTLRYDGNGGFFYNLGGSVDTRDATTTGTSIEVASGDAYGLAREGYSFVEWNMSSAGTSTSFPPGSTYYFNGITIGYLYAQWNRISYNVTLNSNGGSANRTNAVYYGELFEFTSAREPTKTGYTFKGWASSSSAGIEDIEYVTGDSYRVYATKIWYAVWKANTWHLTLNANGGTFPAGSPYNGSSTYSVKKDYHSTTSLAAYSNIVTRLDDTVGGYASYKYEIVGWDEDQNKSWLAVPDYLKSDTLTMPNNDLTLYAIWERLNCIRYLSNGRLFGNIDTVEYMGNYTVKTDEPTWGNHVFKGWSVNGYTSASDVAYHPGDVISNITGYITLTACWGWEPMDEFYWHGSAGADSAVFVSGEPVSEALLASGWNNFYTSLNTYLYRSSGSQLPSPSYTQSGAEITASIFNAARGDLVSSGAASYPVQVSSGDTVYPDYFIGTRGGRFSLRNSLNALIALFNASLED